MYNPDDIDNVLDKLRRLHSPPDEVEVILAPECKNDFSDHDTPLHLRLDDIRHVAALQALDPSGLSSAEYRAILEE